MTYYLAKKPLHNVLFTIIPLLGIVLSFIVSASSYYSDRKLIRAEFNEAVENRYSALKRELDSDLAVLTSLQALYYTSGKDVERSEFRNFTSHILKQYASIQALEWMPRVPDSRREAYERAARREGFPDFQFTERIAQGKMKRAEKRSEYFPVYFVEPYKGNEIALGFDDASTPDRMETLEVARKTGEMRATPRITLVQETRSQFGFIVFAPIYRKGALVNPDQPRWEHLEGFALGVFRIGDIAEKATKYLKPEGVDFSIYDASAPEKERFLYTHSSRTRKTPLLDQEHPGTDFKNSKMIEVAGRKWMVIYSATPDFISARRSWLPWGLLLAGLAFTGLVAGFLVIVRHAGHVEKFAKDLSELNAKLAHEIMERKQIEADLSVKQQQLEELNATLEQRVQEEIVLRQEKEQLLFQQSRMAAMGEMIGAIAHQWRQPLNVIGLIIQNLQMAYEYGELDKERLKNAVATAMWQINFMSKTIDDFRNFFKPSKEKENFDVRKMADETISLMKAQLQNNYIAVEIIAEKKDLVINGYPNEFKHVLMNLINNAKDAILERKVKEDCRSKITIRISEKAGKVIVEVRDTGGGIPDGIMNKIFDPYFTTKDEGTGTGIGLYISKTMIERNMGGQLTAKNWEEGAEFRIEV